MAKFHINPEKGPLPCSAKQGQCPYGADAPHFPTKIEAQSVYEADLAKETKPLGSLRRTSKRIVEAKIADFKDRLESMEYEEIENFANESVDNHKIIDELIKERIEITRERFKKLDKVNPENPNSASAVDRETFRSLKRDYDSYRDTTAELVEAHSESKYYTPAAETLENPEKVGKAVRSTSYAPNSKEWLEARFDTVGGSDVGVLAKLHLADKSEHRGYDKASLKRIEKSKIFFPTAEDVIKSQNLARGNKEGALYRGTVWEQRIRDGYAKDHPEITVYDTKDQFFNPDRPWQKINVDGVISNRADKKPNGIFEAKTGGDPRAWKNGIPSNYRSQVLYYLNATGLEFADIRVELNDSETKEYRLHANDEVVLGSGVKMEDFIENEVGPWFDNLKSQREMKYTAA